jgi:hypothetical protein
LKNPFGSKRLLALLMLALLLTPEKSQAEELEMQTYPVYIDEFYVNQGWELDDITIDEETGLAVKDSPMASLVKNLGFDLRGSTIRGTFRNNGCQLVISVSNTEHNESTLIFKAKTGVHDFETYEWTVPQDLDYSPTVLYWTFGVGGTESALDRLEVLKPSPSSAPLKSPSIENLEGLFQAIEASWRPVAGATGYRIMINETVKDVGAVLSHKESKLTPRSLVSVSVQAYNQYGSGPFSKPERVNVKEGDLSLLFTNEFATLEGLDSRGFATRPEGGIIKTSSKITTAYFLQDTGIDDLRGTLIRVVYHNMGGHIWLRVYGDSNENEVLYSCLPSTSSQPTIGEWFVPPSLPYAPTTYSWSMGGPPGSIIYSVSIYKSSEPKSEHDDEGQVKQYWPLKPKIYFTVQGKVEGVLSDS